MYRSLKQKLGLGAVLLGALYLLFDSLVDLLLEFLHLSFEAVEFTLDVVIEHLFDTDRHATQTITFYILMLIAAYVLYRLGRRLPSWYVAIKTAWADIRHQMIGAALDDWRTASISSRVKWGSALAIGMSLLIWGLLA